ncbi:MAG: hypothetical protein MUF23_00340 [Pirellula sp.]|jgi:hypothetical protein|nr:hypothetical protein [Pirellula sp.]
MNTEPIERGSNRPILDAVGWVIGIPSKILLWNINVDNHHITDETEVAIREYLAANELGHVKVRLNQYRPLDDWRRLTANESVAWPWRYSFGAISVLGETLLPGRLLGGDHFNPYTNTIHLYSDVPTIALHEGAHAKDFARREYPGTYAALYVLPIVPLYHESVATSDVMAYVEAMGSEELAREAHHVLYPAYGTYVGGALGFVFPPVSAPLYYGSVLGGHVAGRVKSRRIAKLPMDSAPTLSTPILSTQPPTDD